MTNLIKLLSPFAPHIADELWSRIGYTTSIHNETWPVYDSEALVSETYQLVIQIQGKLRGTLNVATGTSKEDLQKLALESEIAHKWLEGCVPKRIIVVPGKLVNIVK